MRTLTCIAFTLLCNLSLLSCAPSLQCSERQYSWPVDSPNLCCDMCPPGKRMERRPDHTCKIVCTECVGNRYIDSYNVEMSCSLCRSCDRPNMVYKSNCSASHNAVCDCEAGYRCTDQSCTQCVQIVHTTTTLSPSTAVSTTKRLAPYKPITDTMWFPVIISLLCIVIALAIITKIRPFLFWIRFKSGNFLPVKPASLASCSDFEEVSKPVQEVCGKCDQPIDV